MSTSAKIMSVPFVNVAAQHAAIKAEMLEAMSRVIDSGMFVLGAEVDELERQFAQLIGVKYAVGVNSGTDALIFALRGLGIGPGDEVITAANSFIASAGCAAMIGARPILVDADKDFNMTRRPRTGDHRTHESNHPRPSDRACSQDGRDYADRRSAWRSRG